MKQKILKLAAALFVAAAFAGCSLLKVSVSTGDPLPKEDVRTRVATRGFYEDLTGAVARTADSMAAAAPDVQTRIRAIRWKMKATRAAVDAAMQSIPEVSLADTWILCRRMDAAFAAAPDSALFGAQSPLARAMAAQFEKRADSLARDVLSPGRYALMERFVREYAAEYPSAGAAAGSSNTTLRWLEYLKANGVEHAYASGSISEVLADMNDRIGGRTEQVANSLGWSKDLFELQMQQDSVRTRLEGQLDSLERNFQRIVVVMEHIPEISDAVIGSLNDQIQELIRTMNASVDNAFDNLDRQRDALQIFVSQEREAVMHDASAATDNAIQTMLNGLPAVIGKVVFWLILLTIVVLGLPFAAGFWLGRLRERVHGRRKSE